MAEPISPVIPNNPFSECERILGAGDTNAMPLPIYSTPQGYLSRWKLSEAEVAWIVRHRCIYMLIAGSYHPPIMPLAEAVGVQPDGLLCTIISNDDDDDPLERMAKL